MGRTQDFKLAVADTQTRVITRRAKKRCRKRPKVSNVLLLHGRAFTAEDWFTPFHTDADQKSIADRLNKKGYDVVAVDLPSGPGVPPLNGDSGTTTKSPGDYLNALLQVLDHNLHGFEIDDCAILFPSLSGIHVYELLESGEGRDLKAVYGVAPKNSDLHVGQPTVNNVPFGVSWALGDGLIPYDQTNNLKTVNPSTVVQPVDDVSHAYYFDEALNGSLLVNQLNWFIRNHVD